MKTTWGGPEAGKGKPTGRRAESEGQVEWCEEAGVVGLGTRTGFPVTAVQEAIGLLSSD